MIDPHAYTITVRRRRIEGEAIFEAKVAELPDLVGFGEQYQEAYDFVIDIIAELAADAKKDGVDFPSPQDEAQEDYSGRITLRISPRIHRLAADAAKRELVSLNTYITTALTQESTKADLINDISDAIKQVTVSSDVHRRSSDKNWVYVHQFIGKSDTGSKPIDSFYYAKSRSIFACDPEGHTIGNLAKIEATATEAGGMPWSSPFNMRTDN